MQFKTLLFSTCLSSGVQAWSGFGATCNSWLVTDVAAPYVMFANCRQPSGIYSVGTQLILDHCFANSNGQLVYQANGGWDANCISAGTVGGEFTGTVFYALCKNDAGVYVATSIDLNLYVGNDDGNLAC